MPDFPAAEPLGRRIAAHRSRLCLTQQALAERLALSRNAVSLMETGLSRPSERTVVLLAGLFGVEPLELVEGTDYPGPKVDRLPLVAARHSEAGARLLALEAELRWVELLDHRSAAAALRTIGGELAGLAKLVPEPKEARSLDEARRRVLALLAVRLDRTAGA